MINVGGLYIDCIIVRICRSFVFALDFPHAFQANLLRMQARAGTNSHVLAEFQIPEIAFARLAREWLKTFRTKPLLTAQIAYNLVFPSSKELS